MISRIVASRRCRRPQHSDEPDRRGRPPSFTTSDAAAITTCIEEASFYEKSDPWLDLAKRTGVVKAYQHQHGTKNV